MSGPNNQKLYYWDSCIYLAWILNEQTHGAVHLDAIAQIAKDNFELKNVIITSTITLVEVTYAKLNQQQRDQYQQSFRPDSHLPYDLDKKIAEKARVLRERFLNEPKKLATPDAIHLATAIVHGVDEFHTFDNGKKDARFVGLLDLNGDSRIDNLKVCKPLIPKPPAGLATPPPKDSGQATLFDSLVAPQPPPPGS
jgi:predicted nucleic acid-binding protein